MIHDETVTIRPLRAGDEVAWRDLWAGYLAYYETALPEDVYVSSLARMLSGRRDEFHGMIAEMGGRPVGLVHYHFHPSSWSVTDACYLQDLFTLPEARGRGVARALIEAVYAAADAADAPGVYWFTQDFNATARRLYDRIGTLTPFVRYNRRFGPMTDPQAGVTIRPLGAKDEAAWRRLWAAYLDFYEADLPDEVTQTTFARLLSEDARGMRGLLLEVDGKAAGIVHYVFHRTGWKQEDVCYLQDLYALPELRGRGLGRALIEAVYGKADAAGAPAVYWLTQSFNTTARLLYDRIGVPTPFIAYDRPL